VSVNAYVSYGQKLVALMSWLRVNCSHPFM